MFEGMSEESIARILSATAWSAGLISVGVFLWLAGDKIAAIITALSDNKAFGISLVALAIAALVVRTVIRCG